jgi:hypothetical protein
MRNDGYHDHVPSDTTYDSAWWEEGDRWAWSVERIVSDLDGEELDCQTIAGGFADTEPEARAAMAAALEKASGK